DGDGVAAPLIELHETGMVEEIAKGSGLPDRAAAGQADNGLDFVEIADGQHGDDDQAGGSEKRKGDLAEGFPGAKAVHGGGLVEIAGDLAETADEDDG